MIVAILASVSRQISLHVLHISDYKRKYDSVQDGIVTLHLIHNPFFKYLGNIKLGSKRKKERNIYLDLQLPDLANKIIRCQVTFEFHINRN